VHILLVQYELHFPDCHSLKDKRHILKPLLHELGNEFNVSTAEVDFHDVWQSTLIATVSICNLRDPLERMERRMTDLLEQRGNLQVLQVDRQWL
jgi:hypothetical protein